MIYKSSAGLRNDERIATQQAMKRITGAGIKNTFQTTNLIWQTLKNIP